jgi:TonB family protein
MRLFLLAILGLAPSISNALWIPINADGCTAEILFPRERETATWSGKCANGKIDGYGRLSSSNGTLLEGYFREGVPIDAKGRISAVRDDGRRVALGATYVQGAGDFSHWKKPNDQIVRYSIKVSTFIRGNIVLSENIDGNPVAVVQLKTEPNGRVASFKLLVSSDVPVWDEAVMRAVSRTEALPFDEDGTIPASFELSFRPK